MCCIFVCSFVFLSFYPYFGQRAVHERARDLARPASPLGPLPAELDLPQVVQHTLGVADLNPGDLRAVPEAVVVRYSHKPSRVLNLTEGMRGVL